MRKTISSVELVSSFSHRSPSLLVSYISYYPVNETALHALGNEYNAEILGATDEARSAQALSDELGIPIATCYRRIEELEEADLLEHEGRILSDDRRRVSVYRRAGDRIIESFENEQYSVRVEERADVKNKLDDVWRSLSSS